MVKYMNENVMPIICKGLFAVCKDCDVNEDPVDFLAEYLFTNYR